MDATHKQSLSNNNENTIPSFYYFISSELTDGKVVVFDSIVISVKSFQASYAEDVLNTFSEVYKMANNISNDEGPVNPDLIDVDGDVAIDPEALSSVKNQLSNKMCKFFAETINNGKDILMFASNYTLTNDDISNHLNTQIKTEYGIKAYEMYMLNYL